MYIRSVLDLIIHHSVVGLLSITNQLIDILVNLNGRRNATVLVLKFDVVLSRLFSLGFHLDSIARCFEDLGSLIWNVILLGSLSFAHLTRIDIVVKVFGSSRTVIPAGVIVWSAATSPVLGANLLL